MHQSLLDQGVYPHYVKVWARDSESTVAVHLLLQDAISGLCHFTGALLPPHLRTSFFMLLVKMSSKKMEKSVKNTNEVNRLRQPTD